MSNNKQSSVEWFSEQLKVCASSNFDYTVHHTEILIPTQVFESLIEQAKKIEREYLIEFYIKGCEDTYGMDEGHNDSKDAADYYDKTFK